ncbi:ABC transporter ATP-binding protein [Deinococcus daejeonensis]|uniref:ABC transporter ATP-binding protein n=1 Tax=Deinococcus daejeonensis TaxID=1007098 RepID=A0ABQ2J863_9DEIO|nr:ABC transporter ATP-binding protein [Deinococcus daejeonensis]GGN42227.1 ABC transporter ATP-binding protein [Deinococcus daejeonensis]
MTTTMNRAAPAPLAAERGGAPLTLDGVTYHYQGRRGHGAGVGPLTLDVPGGEFLCVVGPSGSGKSTLLSLLAGFLKPQRGQISLGGEVVRGPHPRLTLVQQEAALFPWLTVAGNVAFGLRGVPRAERDARVQDALRQVGLEGYGPRRPHELSGGQRQRVALARALVTRPGLLLLDEPFSALDHATRTALADELLTLWRQSGVTVVFVTHQLEEALHLGQRVVALRGGQVALDAPAAQTSVDDLKRLLGE